jgi:hypothetical protein
MKQYIFFFCLVFTSAKAGLVDSFLDFFKKPAGEYEQSLHYQASSVPSAQTVPPVLNKSLPTPVATVPQELPKQYTSTQTGPTSFHITNHNEINNQERKEINVFGFNELTSQCKDLFNKGAQTARHYAQSALDWMRAHKLRCFLYGTAATYACLQGYLWSLSQYLSQNTRWSRWHAEKPLEELYALQHKDLVQRLSEDIHDTYINSTNPADVVTPLACFMRDTEKELFYLERYQNILKYLSTFGLQRLFFFNAQLSAEIPLKIQRVHYLRSNFIKHLSRHKVETFQISKEGFNSGKAA